MIGDIKQLMLRAWRQGLAIPSFNICYLPMMRPVIAALRDTDTLGMVTAARVEWEKFQAGGVRPIFEEYQKVKDERYVRLHLDHVPVIDEDNRRVDFQPILQEAIDLGYDSVMVDGSRLSLAQNIAATRQVVEMAAPRGVAVEAELGAVLGHEAGPLPPYEELFASGRGFTDLLEAAQFVRETDVDWLSVAIGNVHGAVSGAAKNSAKIQARLNLEHLRRLKQAVERPLVLHGGTGIKQEYLLAGMRLGIAKINVATAIRQPYEAASRRSVAAGQEAVYETVCRLLREELQLAGSAKALRCQEEDHAH